MGSEKGPIWKQLEANACFTGPTVKFQKTVLETTRFKTRGTNVSPGLLEKRDFESLVPVPTKTLILEERRTHHGCEESSCESE